MSMPTAMELVTLTDHETHGSVQEYLARRVEKVLALHREDVGNRCIHCGFSWPCTTRRILDGEKS